jgi:hypothetical protein
MHGWKNAGDIADAWIDERRVEKVLCQRLA